MITKHLKGFTWNFDEDNKLLTIADERMADNDFVQLDKVRMFSLFRFLIRISQKLSSHRRKHG